MTPPIESVTIARCPEHGLHGERAECFVCGGPVEQVEMVPAEHREDAWDATRLLAGAYDEQLLRSDHVLDDLFDRGFLAYDQRSEQTSLTPAGRAFVVGVLNLSQEQHDGEVAPSSEGGRTPPGQTDDVVVRAVRRACSVTLSNWASREAIVDHLAHEDFVGDVDERLKTAWDKGSLAVGYPGGEMKWRAA